MNGNLACSRVINMTHEAVLSFKSSELNERSCALATALSAARVSARRETYQLSVVIGEVRLAISDRVQRSQIAEVCNELRRAADYLGRNRELQQLVNAVAWCNPGQADPPNVDHSNRPIETFIWQVDASKVLGNQLRLQPPNRSGVNSCKNPSSRRWKGQFGFDLGS